MSLRIRPAPLTADAFRPYGDVIEASAGARQLAINQGTATRFDDLARIDVAAGGGRPSVSIFRAAPRTLPMDLQVMERHPLGSQAFMPLAPSPFLLVVADCDGPPPPEALRAFVTAPGQGVNFARGVWHHPLIAVGQDCDFLVVDRAGPGDNLEEVLLEVGAVLLET